MKVIMRTRSDGRVTRSTPTPEVMAALTGSGYGWSDEKIEREIYKFTHPPEGEPALTETAARRWVEGLAKGGLTEDEAMECVQCRMELKPVILSTVVDEATLPFWMRGTATEQERYEHFRDAATWDGQECKCDMAKARGIQMDRIRYVRNQKLAELDLEYMQADERGDTATKTNIARQKQVLRDIPQTFDLTTPNDTPEELKAMWPAELS